MPHTDDGESGRTSTRTNRRTFLKAAGAGGIMATTGLPGVAGAIQQVNQLDVWLSYYTEGKTKRRYTDRLVQQYEQESGVKINITGVPYTDIVTKFRAARASGDVPHMVEVMTRPGILAGGAGLVINDLFEGTELANKAADTIMEGHRVWGAQSTGQEGNLVTVPLGFRPYFTVWRTDWLNQAGIDKSEVNHEAGSLHWYDDIPDIYDRLKQTQRGQQQGNFPDTTGMKQSDEEYLSLYIPQHGGSLSGVVNLKGDKATIDTPAARRAIKMQFNYIDQGYFHENSINHGDEESTTLHWSGKLAVNHLQDSTDLWGDYLEEQGQAMRNGAYTWGLPRNAGTKASLAWLPALGFMKEGFSNQAEQRAAMDFVNWWIADDQRATQNAKNLGFVPVTPSSIESEPFFGQTEMHTEFWRGACLKTLNQFQPSVIPAVAGANAITYDIPRQMHQRIAMATQRGTGLDQAVNQATSQAAQEINQLLQRNQ